MPVTIRPATLTDAPAIAHVQVSSWRTTYRNIVPDSFLNQLTVPAQTERWTEWLQLPGLLSFVAESGQHVVGFASGGPIRESEGNYDAELYAIYLLESSQRQGTGRHLLRALSSALIANSFRGLLVWVLEANPSVRFYQDLGAMEHRRKTITLGDIDLPEISFGWPDLTTLVQT